MTLSSRQKNQLMDKLNQTIDEFIKWRMPKSSRNNEGAAWKLFLSHHLASRANKMKELAETEAVKAGVLFDKTKNPRPEGSREPVFNGEVVLVMCEVRKAASRVNTDLLIELLGEAGVAPGILAEAVASATLKSRPAHVFTTMLVTEEANGK